MTDRPAARWSTAAPQRAPETSVIPGRIRIVAWIMLATALGLLAVVITLRSAALAEIEREANADVAQEIDEFRTFASEGRDPDTGAAFTDAVRMLTLHLQREFPGSDEVLLGWDAAREGRKALVVQDVADPVGLTVEPDLVAELVRADQTSGIATTTAGVAFRWGTVHVDTTGSPGPGGTFLVAVGTQEDRAEVDQQLLVVGAVCLGGLLVTSGIAWVAAGAILRPVRLVRRAAARITRADLGERIPATGRDDVSALASTFNGMLDRLERAFSAQARFSASAGAHLRPALAIVRERSAHDDEAADAVTRMELILDDLAVLAASERAAFVTTRRTSTGELVDALAERVAIQVGGTHVVRVGECDLVDVELDPDRLTDAVLRLARNAAQQAPAGSTITLQCRTTAEHVEISLTDEGTGLTPEAARLALERYDEPHGPTTGPDHIGPGLGLAVVRAVADAHEGSLWVETAPGAGATFGLALPRHGSPQGGPHTGTGAWTLPTSPEVPA
ncbi:ATP-binding protein [Nocardioides sp.]|uniref:sensor histidine kinase n=1 Tax=Nocardioides sp. TaxID=35761 RepID=UPI00286A1FB6|nr:ATP-binding protein [Nocardioides sp.]